MPSLRQIRRRVRSVENTKKITRAMEMVAAAKLRRFEELLAKARESTSFLDRLLKNLLADVTAYEHPLFTEREKKERLALVLVTSDTGLCGVYNANVIHKAIDFIKGNSGKRVEIVPVGKSGLNFFKKRGEKIETSFVEIRISNLENIVHELTEYVTNSFLSGTFDEVYLLYTHFLSKSSYKPRVEKFLNLERPAEATRAKVGYILEPSAERIFEELLPKFLHGKLKTMLLEASLSEHISRMLAMRQATDNATEMIEDLTLLRNKLRQASITKELIEVVSGARALKR